MDVRIFTSSVMPIKDVNFTNRCKTMYIVMPWIQGSYIYCQTLCPLKDVKQNTKEGIYVFLPGFVGPIHWEMRETFWVIKSIFFAHFQLENKRTTPKEKKNFKEKCFQITVPCAASPEISLKQSPSPYEPN